MNIKSFFKGIGATVLVLILLVLLLFGYFNLPGATPREDVSLGMTFSARYAEGLGLDARETYLALLDDMGVKKMRLPVYWDLVEKEKDVYDFSEVDWQIAEAGRRDADVILTVGLKVPRWPECHIPQWATESDAIRKQGILSFIEKTVERYKENQTVVKWQVENEPFLPFGICPEFDVAFLEQEVALVKRLDTTRPVLLTDSGELSLWYGAAKRGDEFGTTLYRDIYSKKVGGYFTYPIGPNFFRFKAWIVRTFAQQNNLSVIELQAEPWASGWVASVPLEEQFLTMNEVKLRENVDYARRVGFHDIYLWGGEWWYWMKVKQGYPAIWETGKELFQMYGKK
ncbi:MAG: cellulase family glycosylhydrolase [Candidatus Moraniibacteriota bacterium]